MKMPALCICIFALIPTLLISQQPFSAMEVDSNTVALWHFNEGSGSILHDASPYHNDGEIHNAEWVEGKFGSALHFDGFTTYVILPNAPSLKPETEFTIEAWISLDSLVFPYLAPPNFSAATIVSNLGRYPDGGGYQMDVYSKVGLVFTYKVTSEAINHNSHPIPILSTHQFYHVAAIYQRVPRIDNPLDSVTVIRTYLNGVLGDSSAFP